MHTFQVSFFDGHAMIYQDDHIILIDTGSPATIHTSGQLNLCDDIHRCHTSFMGLTVERISELVGSRITTLLGADILSRYKILFDYRNGEITFSQNDIIMDGTEVSIGNFMGVPIIDLFVDNRSLKFFLDTGAKLSYLPQNITGNYPSAGRADDFHPSAGRFQTDYFEISTTLGDVRFVAKYGNLPNILKSTLMAADTEGIIGFDFFNQLKVVLDLQNRKMKYTQY